MPHEGMIFASDSRTHAGVNAFAKFCKMTVFERRGNRVIVLLSWETWPELRPSSAS